MEWLTFQATMLMMISTPVAAQHGGCGFDSRTLSFEGSEQTQAECLLRKVKIGGALEAQPLPAGLRQRLGQALVMSSSQRRNSLAALDAESRSRLMPSIMQPVSRAASGAAAKYFVIHDTSSPYLRDNPFPEDLDTNNRVNRLTGYLGPKAVAHYFVNRGGEVAVGHDMSVPWRATKLETRVVGNPSRGRFLHVELVQPRRRDPNAGGLNNDRLAPEPGFSDRQYSALAALYVLASARSARWLIPSFHAAIDDGIAGGHDDPQKFDLIRFEGAVAATLAGTQSGAAAPAEATSVAATARWGSLPPRDTWTVMALAAVDQLGTQLWSPDFVPNDIANYCPAYAQKGVAERKLFWVGLMSSLARFESNYDPAVTFRESFNDAQGRPVISRGLLQISMESANGYGCAISQAAQLHDPQTNLSCGVRILNRQVRRHGVIATRRDGRWLGAASYWSPFRRDDRRSDLARWVAQQPYCTA